MNEEIERFQTMLKQDPSNFQIRRELSVLLANNGFNEEALSNPATKKGIEMFTLVRRLGKIEEISAPATQTIEPVKVSEVKKQTEEEHVEEWQSALADLKEEEDDLQVAVPQEEPVVAVKEEPQKEDVKFEPKVEVAVEQPKQETIVSREPEVAPKTVTSPASNDRFKTTVRGLGGARSAEGRFVKDLKRALNLNDRIRYKKELFGGDKELMDRTIDRLDVCLSLNEALEYVSQFAWDDDNEAVVDFISLLERRFSK